MSVWNLICDFYSWWTLRYQCKLQRQRQRVHCAFLWLPLLNLLTPFTEGVQFNVVVWFVAGVADVPAALQTPDIGTINRWETLCWWIYITDSSHIISFINTDVDISAGCYGTLFQRLQVRGKTKIIYDPRCCHVNNKLHMREIDDNPDIVTYTRIVVPRTCWRECWLYMVIMLRGKVVVSVLWKTKTAFHRDCLLKSELYSYRFRDSKPMALRSRWLSATNATFLLLDF